MTEFDFEAMALNIIKDRPASAETISVILGLPTNYVLMNLNRMKKWGLIEQVTKKEVMIWSTPRRSGLMAGRYLSGKAGPGLVPAGRAKVSPG
jgi:hypothetical protein